MSNVDYLAGPAATAVDLGTLLAQPPDVYVGRTDQTLAVPAWSADGWSAPPFPLFANADSPVCAASGGYGLYGTVLMSITRGDGSYVATNKYFSIDLTGSTFEPLTGPLSLSISGVLGSWSGTLAPGASASTLATMGGVALGATWTRSANGLSMSCAAWGCSFSVSAGTARYSTPASQTSGAGTVVAATGYLSAGTDLQQRFLRAVAATYTNVQMSSGLWAGTFGSKALAANGGTGELWAQVQAFNWSDVANKIATGKFGISSTPFDAVSEALYPGMFNITWSVAGQGESLSFAQGAIFPGSSTPTAINAAALPISCNIRMTRGRGTSWVGSSTGNEFGFAATTLAVGATVWSSWMETSSLKVRMGVLRESVDMFRIRFDLVNQGMYNAITVSISDWSGYSSHYSMQAAGVTPEAAATGFLVNGVDLNTVISGR